MDNARGSITLLLAGMVGLTMLVSASLVSVASGRMALQKGRYFQSGQEVFDAEVAALHGYYALRAGLLHPESSGRRALAFSSTEAPAGSLNANSRVGISVNDPVGVGHSFTQRFSVGEMFLNLPRAISSDPTSFDFSSSPLCGARRAFSHASGGPSQTCLRFVEAPPSPAPPTGIPPTESPESSPGYYISMACDRRTTDRWYALMVARFSGDGRLDRHFGDGGIARYEMSGGLIVPSLLAVQPDGGILLAGHEQVDRAGNLPQSQSTFFFHRFLHDGRNDEAFAQGGHRRTTVPATRGGSDTNLGQQSTLLLSSGKILSFGWEETHPTDIPIMARFHSDGTLDRSFGGGSGVASYSRVSGNNGGFYASAVELSDGGILAVGGEHNPNRTYLSRYFSDGMADTSFGDSGTLNISSFLAFKAAAWARHAPLVQSDEKIVLGFGAAIVPRGPAGPRRLSGNGAMEAHYPALNSESLTFSLDENSDTYALAIQQDDKPVAFRRGVNFGTWGMSSHSALFRYNTDGSYDMSFGDSGSLPLPTLDGSTMRQAVIQDLHVLPNGKILGAGGVGVIRHFRITAQGALDSRFGTGDGEGDRLELPDCQAYRLATIPPVSN